MDEDELPSLNGARVLVVQGDPFIAADLDLMIEDAGGEVVALAATLQDVVGVLAQERIDAAVVDPDLDEGALVIEELKRRGMPFVSFRRDADTEHPARPSVPLALATALAVALKLLPALEQAQTLI